MPLDDHSIATRSVGRSHRQCPFDGQSNQPLIQIKLILGARSSFIESKYKFPSFLAVPREKLEGDRVPRTRNKNGRHSIDLVASRHTLYERILAGAEPSMLNAHLIWPNVETSADYHVFVVCMIRLRFRCFANFCVET